MQISCDVENILDLGGFFGGEYRLEFDLISGCHLYHHLRKAVKRIEVLHIPEVIGFDLRDGGFEGVIYTASDIAHAEFVGNRFDLILGCGEREPYRLGVQLVILIDRRMGDLQTESVPSGHVALRELLTVIYLWVFIFACKDIFTIDIYAVIQASLKPADCGGIDQI